MEDFLNRYSLQMQNVRLHDIQERAYYIYLRTGCTNEKVNWDQARLEIQREKEYQAKMAIMHQERPDILKSDSQKDIIKLSPHERELSHKAKVRAYYYWKETGCYDSRKNYFLALEEERKIEKYHQLEQKWSQYLDVINRCIDHETRDMIRRNKRGSHSPGRAYAGKKSSPYRERMRIYSISESEDEDDEIDDEIKKTMKHTMNNTFNNRVHTPLLT